MKALTLTADHSLTLTDRPKPEVRTATDVVIRIEQSGICGTDRSVLVGKFSAEPGVVMGHEAVGTVETTGSAVTRLAPGDRVVINPTLYCGACPTCLEGHWNFCTNKSGTEVGLDYDGSFAEYIRLPELFCHPIPEGMSLDRAVLIEPLACAMNNIEAGELRPGETAVIVGGGPVGAVCALAAQHYGARVLLVEPDPTRQELIRDVLSYHQLAERISLHTPDASELSERGNLVIDTVGNLLEASLHYAAQRGRIVVMGYHSEATATVRPLTLLQRGLRIIGAGDYNSNIFPKAIELARQLPLERVITHRYRLEDFPDALKAIAAVPGADYAALKVLLLPRPDGALA